MLTKPFQEEADGSSESGSGDIVVKIMRSFIDGLKSEDSSESCKTSAAKDRRECYKRRFTMTKKKRRPRSMSEVLRVSTSRSLNIVKTPSRLSSQTNSAGQSSDAQSSESVTKKQGRGPAKGPKEWGTGIKIEVEFDSTFQPVGNRASELKTAMGNIVRNGYRVPLTYIDWNSVPTDVLDSIWSEVQDNLLFAPPEFREVCLKGCKKAWREHKYRIKKKYYEPCKTDVNLSSNIPPEIVSQQWQELVQYWGSDIANKISNQNSRNRECQGPIHRSGRTHFAQLRRQMEENGERTDKISIYIKTRTKNGVPCDPVAAKIIEEFQERLSQVPESDQTPTLRDRIFHEVLGEDGHGYCKTYGTGVPRSAVYKQNTSSSDVINPMFIDQICRTVRADVEQQLKETMRAEVEQQLKETMRADVAQQYIERMRAEVDQQVKAEFDLMQAKITFLESQLKNGCEPMVAQQASDLIRTQIESGRDGLPQSQEEPHAVSPSIRPANKVQIRTTVGNKGKRVLFEPDCFKVGDKVDLLSSKVPKRIVAEGHIISMDQLTEIDGIPLGSNFWQVFIENARDPKVCLIRSRRGILTLGQAVQRNIAWPSVDVSLRE